MKLTHDMKSIWTDREGSVTCGRGVVARLLALCLGSLVALGTGELLTRWYYAFEARAQTRGGEGRIDEYDPRLGVRLIPNSRGREWSPEFDVELRINGQGFRMDRDVRTDGTSRIVLVGDSFTFGDGVDVAERYGDRLAF